MNEPFFDLSAGLARDRALFLEDTRDEARDLLRVILAAYEMAGETLMPTPLVAALESAKRYMA